LPLILMGNFVELAITGKLLLVRIILRNVMNATKEENNIIKTGIRVNTVIDF